MAELTKPQYQSNRNQVYNVAPAQEQYRGPDENVGQVNLSNAKIFDALLDGMGVFSEIYQKSEQTATRLKAKEILIKKMKHHENQKLLLKEHLPFTDPAEIGLQTSLSKFRQEDELGRTMYNIGKDLNVNISPMKLPDDVSDAVLELIEEPFVRMDGDLLTAIVTQVEQAQTAQDLNYLTFEQRNFRSKIRAGFASSKYESHTGLQFAKGHLEEMIAGIMERSEEGGTLDAYEIEEQIDKSVQAMLQEWYNHDVFNPEIRKDTVIANAEDGVYKYKIGKKTFILSPNYYQADVVGRNNKNEQTFLQNRDQEEAQYLDDRFETYTHMYSGKNFKGADAALEDLMNIPKMKQGKALRWVREEIALKENREVSNLEQEILRDHEYDGKSLLFKLTDPVTKDGKLVLDDNGNKKLKPKTGGALKTALTRLYGKYTPDEISKIKEGLISQLITTSLKQDRQAQKVDLTTIQQSYVSRLAIQAQGPKSSAGVLKRFTSLNVNQELEIDGAKVGIDEGLIGAFGEGRTDEKIKAIAGVVSKAIAVHKAHLKSMSGKDVAPRQHTQNLISITSEYVQNAQSALEDGFKNPRGGGALIAPGEEEGPEFWTRYRQVQGNRNSSQLLDEHELEDKLDGMLSIGQNIVNRNLQELEKDIEFLDREYPSDSLTQPLKSIIVKAIEVRRTNLMKNPAALALKETEQDIEQALRENKQINVQALYDWQEKYGVKDRSKLLPENVLAQVGYFTEQGKDLQKRLELYTQIYAMSELFGEKTTQDIAKWQFRQSIKGSGITGAKSGTPALAFLTDIWDKIEATDKLELFEIATTKFSASDEPIAETTFGEVKFSAIKRIMKEQHQLYGMKSTMQSHSQIDDLSVFEEKILRARADSTHYQGKSAKEIAELIHDELFPDNYILQTYEEGKARKLNAVVSRKALKANGLNEEDAKGAQGFILDRMDTEGATWTLMQSVGEITEDVLVSNFKESLLSDLPPNVRRWEDREGRIWERVDDGPPREVYADLLTKLRDKQTRQITEDVVKANSDNLRKGLISVGDGYQIGVYLIDEKNINQAKLIGKFFEVKNGKNVPRYISQQEFVGAAGSPYIINFLMNPKFLTHHLHQYVRDLRTEGIKKASQGTLQDKVSTIPFFRLIDGLGKLELDQAVEPLHSAMEKKAKELGVETLSYRDARDLLEEFAGRQNRWYKSDYIPDFIQKGLKFISNKLLITE